MPLPKPTTKITEIDEQHWTATDARDPAHVAFRERQLVERTYELYGLRLACPPGIYHPDEGSSTRFMLRELSSSSAQRFGPRALDVGTGSGAVALFLARSGKEVIAVDVDPEAVACAQANARDNGISLDVRRSDLFEAVEGERFDLILFNAPLRHGDIEHPVDRIACDPGGALTVRFLKEASDYLAPGGAIVLVAASAGRREAFIEGLQGLDHRVIAAEYSEGTGGSRWLLLVQKP